MAKQTRKKKTLKAFGLLEMVIVIGLLGVLIGSVYIFGILSAEFSERRRLRNELVLAINETVNAAIISRDDSWESIKDNTDDGIKHFAFSSNTYQIQDGYDTSGDNQIGFTINAVYRDSNNLISDAGQADEDTRKLEITASGTDQFGNDLTISTDLYISNWNTPRWSDNFDSGVFDNLIEDPGGTIRFKSNLDISGDWCEVEPTLKTYDIQGNAEYSAIHSDIGEVFLSSIDEDNSFYYGTFDFDTEDTITTEKEFSGYVVNEVYMLDADTALLATTDNDKELVIVDISGTPAEVGHADLPGEADPTVLAYSPASSGQAHIIQGDQFHIVDLSSTTGSRSVLGSFALKGTGVAYDRSVSTEVAIAIQGGDTDVQLIDISTPASMSESGTVDLPSSASLATAVAVLDSDDRMFVGTFYSATQPEVYIVDTSSTPTVSSNFDVDITVNRINKNAYSDDRLIVAGEGGEYQLQVLDVENESSITRCFETTLDSKILDLNYEVDSGDVYGYALTDNKDGEIMVFRGGSELKGLGPGGQFFMTGSYTSETFNTELTSPDYLSLTWQEITTINTDIHFQIRTGSSSDLSAVSWVGPDGTSLTFFEDPVDGQNLPASISGNNKGYVQYKAFFFSTDGVNTPLLRKVILNYE